MEKSEFPQVRNWKYEQDEDNIFWLILDKEDTVNTLGPEVLTEFKEILDYLEFLKPRGLCISSGKKNGFIAGADIMQIKNVENVEDAFALIQQGQRVFNQLSKLPFPTLALIRGYCLGGGLELSLACRYRVAINDPKTKLGFPEVMLGIHPGWGGTVRLPRLIGPLKAFSLIIAGKSLSAPEAAKLGVVDASIPIWDDERAVKYFLLKDPAGQGSNAKNFKGTKNLNAIFNIKFCRDLAAKFMEWKLAKKINRNHYPAPFAVIENWQACDLQSDEAFLVEAQSVSRLMVTDITRNMVRVFTLQERLKSLFRDTQFKPRHIHIVGAGVMGGDIAAWCAFKGFRVTLQDQNENAIAKAMGRAMSFFKKRLKTPYLYRAAMDRLTGDSEGIGIAKADFILEAIVEDRAAKQALFREIEQKAKPDAIFATNTSTIPLEEIADVLSDKSRLVGLHFFNPVAKMPLVEVILTSGSKDPHKLAELCSFARLLDKLPLPVKSSPGFLVNRLLMPYLLESVRILSEGVAPEVIDRAAKDFGMPMGPLELMDTVGLDICYHSLEALKQEIPDRIQEVPDILAKMVKAGNLGKKTGSGFYQYKNGKPVLKKVESQAIPQDITDRLILRMVNEAVACLREKIVEDGDLIDAGMIFGTGFPPFRGDPIHYALEQGEGLILQRLNLLAQRYGDRFLADPGWSRLDAV